MRVIVGGVIAAIVALLAGRAMAASHSGGVRTGPVVVVNFAGPSFFGTPAYVALMVGPPSPESGVLEPGTVIGVRTARAQDAIVLTEALNDGGVQIDAGTVMVKVIFEPRVLVGRVNPRIFWCSVRPMPLLHFPTQDCLSDPEGTGKLHWYSAALVRDRRAPFAILSVARAERPVPPLAYRPAQPDELPSVKFGYRFCGDEGDGVSIPLRFDSVIANFDGGWLGSGHSCGFGDWPDLNDRSLESVDQMTIRLHPGEPVRYEIESAVPAGPLGLVHPGDSIRPQSAPAAYEARALEALSSPALAPEGPGRPTVGLVQHGADVVLVNVRHGITGALRYPVRLPSLFGSRRLDTGHYMFGVPTLDRDDEFDRGSLSWCAPDFSSGPPTRISTVCFATFGGKTISEAMGNVLAVLSFSYSQTDFGLAGGVSVERKPMTLPTSMTLAYVFDHWVTDVSVVGRRVLCAQLGVEIRVQEIMTPIGHMLVCPSPEGFRFALLGGVMSASPVDASGHAITPRLTAGSDAEMDEVLNGMDRSRAELRVISPLVGGRPLPIRGRFAADLPPPPPLQLLLPLPSKGTQPSMLPRVKRPFPEFGPPAPASAPSARADP